MECPALITYHLLISPTDLSTVFPEVMCQIQNMLYFLILDTNTCIKTEGNMEVFQKSATRVG